MTEPTAPTAPKGKMREYVEAFAWALVIALIIRTLAFQAFKIPSGSMEDTLLVGDHIFVSKFSYGYHFPGTKGRILSIGDPQRGDIVVFEFPQEPSKDYIKRIVGLPGDKVEIRDKVVLINETSLDESYAIFKGGDSPFDLALKGRSMPPVTVPEGKYFMMGDNRDRSFDSRFWGFVDEEALVGKAQVMYFSIDWGRGVKLYEVWRWPSMVRWSRLGKMVR